LLNLHSLLQVFVVDTFTIRKFVVYLQYLKLILNMKQELEWVQLTSEEIDLIAAIRNYNKSYPDGYPELLWYAQQLFDNMLRQPYN
jgi:hypothetical protein